MGPMSGGRWAVATSRTTSNRDHTLFDQMVAPGLATDRNDARDRCFDAFRTTPEYQKHSEGLQKLITDAIAHFTAISD